MNFLGNVLTYLGASQVEIVEGFFDDLGRRRADTLLLYLLRLALGHAALL